ncbi:hypothetical protein WMF37_19125 [Sorangium sp. So ce291]|uniref:hypothetical protein n=1 Tax=Sorangium sp. So ce291 TaxID=3133294 RepID=UPI003F637EA1
MIDVIDATPGRARAPGLLPELTASMAHDISISDEATLMEESGHHVSVPLGALGTPVVSFASDLRQHHPTSSHHPG